MAKGQFVYEPEFRKYFFWAIAVVLIVVSFFIVRGFFVALISAFILAYLTKPIHRRMERKMGKKVSALVIVVGVILVLVIPAGLVLTSLAGQVSEYISSGRVESLWMEFSQLPYIGDLLENFELDGRDAFSPLLSYLASALSYVPALFLTVFVTLFGLYFILVSWERLAVNLQRYIPFRDKKRVVNEMSEVTNAIVYGTFFVGLIEFVIAAIGFYFFGIRFYLLIALLIFFFAFIPGLGPIVVW